MRTFRGTALALIGLLALSGSACQRGVDRAAISPHASPSAELEEDAAGGGDGDHEREGDGDADRIDRRGVAARTGPVRHDPTAGWRGAKLFGRANDWEPATAADRADPYVYVLTTRYSGKGPLPCPSCDLPAMAYRVSSDGGRTFGPVRYLQPNIPGGQYDPQLATDAAGEVLASWMDGKSRIMFSKSDDHGRTWTPTRVVSHGAGWGDHPWLGVSPNGQHVYIGFNHASSWVAQSHDGGSTWLPAQQISTEDRYYFANGTVVTDDGDVAISTASYAQPYSTVGRRKPILIEVERSTDGGATFDSTLVDTVQQPRGCVSDGCPFGHYGGHAVIAFAEDAMVIAYDGAVNAGEDQYLWVRRSTDFGVTWSSRARISAKAPDMVAMNPGITAGENGEVRVAWQDSRNGSFRWNTFVRASHDGGASWDLAVDVSDASSGYGYLHPRGYDADYGDYMQVALTSDGSTFAVWGAAFGYAGPGGTWFNVEA
ncbi:MAG: sialidase family protein [Actinomycetota bacterium]